MQTNNLKRLLSVSIGLMILFSADYGFAWVPGAPCGKNKSYDCRGQCIKDKTIEDWRGDGLCDDGTWGVYLNCPEFDCDDGDCDDCEPPQQDCYYDGDGDGYGDTNNSVQGICADIDDYVELSGDCNDTDPAINPGAVDNTCDDIDNNCDGERDEDAPTTLYYRDLDGDQYGDPDQSLLRCGPPANYVADNTDCDDTNPDIHPGAYDTCGNGIDEDCDGTDRECGSVASVCADLSDVPLETQIESAPPIVMLLMDDSGSMAWDLLCPRYQGLYGLPSDIGSAYSNRSYSRTESGTTYYFWDYYSDLPLFWHTQWADYNGIYYNPDLDYAPWPDTDTQYDDANKDTPKIHPHSATTRTLNNQFVLVDGVSIRWAHYYVWSNDQNAPYLVNITGSLGTYDLNYYKVNSCNNGTCGSVYSSVRSLTAVAPPTDVASDRSPAEERQNFANWYQYYRTRQLTAISALANVVNSINGMEIGLHSINHNNSINMILPRMVDAQIVDDHRNDVLDDLYRVGASGGTPLRLGLQAIGDFYDDDENGPFWADVDGGECQQAYTILMTDGYYNGNNPDDKIGNADGADNTGQIDGFDKGEFGDTYSKTLADVAMYYYERDLNDGLEDLVPTTPKDPSTLGSMHQHMVTYTVSFGLKGLFDPNDPTYVCPGSNCPPWPNVTSSSEDERSITDLWHAAVNGRGEYMEAKNTTQLAYALTTMLQQIADQGGSGASVAVNSHELKQDTKMYQGTYDSADWRGDLTAYNINSDGSVNKANPVWSATQLLDARVVTNGHSDRKIYTMGASSGVEFTSANISSLTNAQQNYLGADLASRTKLVNFIRGDFSNDKNHNGGYRNRSTRLGDIIHSESKYVNGYLYVGANDGMLHVFSANTGQEVFAYIPSFVYPSLEQLSNPDYSHRYFVDLTPALAQVGTDVFLIGGLGKGGKGYFCLNVNINNPSSFTAADVKWEYPGSATPAAEVANMGFTFSQPAIIETENGTKYLFFGNGYDSPNARAVLYALNPATGQKVAMIDTGYGSSIISDDNCNGLSTPEFIDTNNNGKADYAYAGDLRGNVWKFNISGDPASWAVAYGGNPLFQARDSSGSPQPITTKVAVKSHCVRGYLGNIVVFGTGKLNATEDFTDTSVQAVYGVWDWAAEWEEEKMTIGAGEDKYLGAFNSPSVGKLSNLVSVLTSVGNKVTLIGQSGTKDTETHEDRDWSKTSINDISWFNVKAYLKKGSAYGSEIGEGYHVGWTFALPYERERVLAEPILWLDYALITSQVPSDTVCTVGGDSYLTALNVCSGAAPDDAVFDVNNDNKINQDDQVADETLNRLSLDDFKIYSPTMIEDFLYYGPEADENIMIKTEDSGILFWRFWDLE